MLAQMRLEWTCQVCRFALSTGARANRVLSLTWDKVDLDQSASSQKVAGAIMRVRPMEPHFSSPAL